MTLVEGMLHISFIGIYLTFYFFDLTSDQGEYTSSLFVSWMTVNSMILIVSDYKRLCREKADTVAIYTEAFLGKITSILVTIFHDFRANTFSDVWRSRTILVFVSSGNDERLVFFGDCGMCDYAGFCEVHSIINQQYLRITFFGVPRMIVYKEDLGKVLSFF